MNEAIHFGHPNDAASVVQSLQQRLGPNENEWHKANNLFNVDRLDCADEAVFLKDELGTVIALGLICKTHPCVVSYYTVAEYRGKGYGYELLLACIERILEQNPDALIWIEPTKQTVVDHIDRLPPEIRRRLSIRW